MMADLVQRHETLAKTAREVMPVVRNAKDDVTADMLIARMNVHEKAAWMWRSFLEQ